MIAELNLKNTKEQRIMYTYSWKICLVLLMLALNPSSVSRSWHREEKLDMVVIY